MALNTITQVKLLNGKVIDMVDWTDKPVFSTVDLQTGFQTQEISLFQYVVGDTVPAFTPSGTSPTQRTATDRETNMQAPGAMSSSEEMLVYAIKPEINFYYLTGNDFNTLGYVPGDDIDFPGGFPQPTPTGLAVLCSHLILELEISQKAYAYAGLGYFNAGFGVATSNFGLGSYQPGGNLGMATQEAVRSFVIPHHIGSQEKFRGILNNSSGINDGNVDFGVVTVIGEGTTVALRADVAATVRIILDGLYKRPVS